MTGFATKLIVIVLADVGGEAWAQLSDAPVWRLRTIFVGFASVQTMSIYLLHAQVSLASSLPKPRLM